MFPFSLWSGTKPAPEKSTQPSAPASTSTAAPDLSSTAAAAPTNPDPLSLPHLQPEPHPPILSPRSLKQLGLFFGGAGFLYLSVLISRRAVARHQIAAQLKFFQPNSWKNAGGPEKVPPKRDPMVAVEALNLATLNTLSFFVMAAGGVSWAFNISSAEDLKRITQRSILRSSAGKSVDLEAEKEVVEWVARTFGVDATEAEEAVEGKGEGESKGEGEGQEEGK